MDRGLRFRTARSVLATLLLLLSPLGLRADSVFDARGFNPFRAPTSELPYEHVDPLTGNLLLTFTDLVLPGDAGFDLRIQRTYNSKLYPDYHNGQRTPPEDSWAGIGWTLHMGRIPNPGLWMEPYPAIEMPDGSQHQLYSHADGSGRFVTRDHWVYDRSGALPVLRLPNGVEYTFGKDLTLSLGGPFLYVTLITDPFGNRITVQYMTPPTYPADGIASITQTVGGTSRTVTFQATTDSVKRLSTMKYGGRTWTYPATSSGSTLSYLTGLTPPTGPGWSFTYYGSSTSLPLPHGLKSITTPFGGVISYEYQEIEFYLGTTYPRRSPALSKRTTSGTDLTGGVWTYSYAQGPSENQTVIASPCNTVTHTFDGVGTLTTPGGLWRVGLSTRRQVKESSTVLETEDLAWQPSVPVSNDFETVGFNQDAGIFVPLQQTRTVTRGTRSYQTTYTYRTTNYNDYGRPWTVGEVGDLGRTQTLTYKYGFSPRYIVDKLDTETIQQGSESFTSSFAYSSSTGFKTSQIIRGITTTFTPDARGNVATETDAHGPTTPAMPMATMASTG